MKKIFCLAFVLLMTIGVFAQERIIEKTEFDAVMVRSFKRYAGQSYRRTENTQSIPGSTVQSQINTKLVMEFAGGRASRFITEFDSPTLKRKTERIVVGGKTYVRTNDGEWTQKASESRENFENPFKTVQDETEYKSLGTEILNGQQTTVYAKIRRQKQVNESSGGELSATITVKSWFGEDGGILKQETEIENRVKSPKNPSEAVIRHSRVEVWELDPNIKIEAPIADK